MTLYIKLFVAVIVLSCKQGTMDTTISLIDSISDKKEIIVTSTAAQNSDTTLTDYKNYLTTLDKEQMNNVRAAILNYQWLFKDKDSLTCDSGYALFHQFYGSVYGHVQEQRPKVSEKRRSEFIKQIKLYGFTIAKYEGEDYYTEARDSINLLFYPFVSTTMKNFLQQLHIETNKKAAAAEGGLTISAEELAERYVFWQRFGKLYPKFLLHTSVFMFANDYAEKLVHGTENTPLQIEGKLNEIYKKTFDYLFSKYGNERFVILYKKYYQALLTKDEKAIHEFKEWFSSYENKEILCYEEK